MPYYEVRVICSKNVCVKADDEHEAERIASEELLGDFYNSEGVIVDEYDENSPSDMELVQQYKDQNEYFED